jgi:RNA 3'-terminal phosphate cyclase-like protein
MLRFKGAEHFRQRLVLSTLSGRPIRIDDIRAADQAPGLRDHEASLLRLLEKLCDGVVVEINETGTSLRYRPGLVVGGAGLEHDCGAGRAIGWFLEPLAVLALFGRKPLEATLRGVTNDGVDPGVDAWRAATLPLLRAATGADGFELKVVRRGCRPGGGGEVELRVPVLRALPPVSLTDEGMVKRVRGVAHASRVAPAAANRLVDGARGVLNALLADVYIFTDAARGAEAGASPGFGLTLVAETTSGRLLSAEASAAPRAPRGAGAAVGDAEAEAPEDVGRRAAAALLEEVSRGGVVDSAHQGLAILLCALGPEEVGELRLGPLTPHAVRTLRHVRDFLGVTFAVRPERGSRTIFLSCVGAGVENRSRRLG